MIHRRLPGRLAVWVAVALAAALVAPAAVAGAANPQIVPSETLVSPCRIMDTRAASQVGPRGTPLAGGETHTIQVTGANGNCVVPADAGGVVLNVTVVGPQSSGFVTVFPGGTTRPTASNLNYTAGQAPVPNQVTVGLGATGQVSFFASGGPVNLVADVVGVTSRPRLTATQLAELDWGADRGRPGTVTVGSSPSGVATDGASVWVADNGPDTVSRIDPARNAVTATVSLPAGSDPTGVAFGAGSIWVANTGTNTVSRINPNTATTVGAPIAVGAAPISVAFGAGSIWVANQNGASVSRIDPATGAVVATIPVGSSPSAVAFGARSVWVSSTGTSKVFRINPSSNAVIAQVNVGVIPVALAYDGEDVWVANLSSNNVVRIDPALDAATQTVPTGPGTNPSGLVFDGSSIWVANQGTATVSRIDVVDGSITPGTQAAPVGPAPGPMVFDGTNVWVANSAANTVSKLRTGSAGSPVVSPETLISPCRIMDTRAASQVGPRGTPLAGGETHTIQVTGANGDCVVPGDAAGVVLNVTVVGPQSSGFVTVFPGGTTRPTASNLNYTAGQAPVPNQVTVGLGATGQVSFFASGGPVNLVADVAGYTARARLTATQLAQLDWDADRARPGTTAVGFNPTAATFDGSSVWVANAGSSSLSQILPGAGEVTATVALPVGANPQGLAFGVGSVWVTDFALDQVLRIDPSTGTTTATIPLPAGADPFGVAFGDGSTWVVNQGPDTVSRIDPVSNAVTATVALPSGSNAQSVAFGAGSLWVGNLSLNSLTRIDAATNSVVTTIGLSSSPIGLAYDGADVWVGSSSGSSVSRVSPVTNTVVGTVPTFAANPIGLTFDGTYLWAANQGGNSVTRIDLSVVPPSPELIGVGSLPRGVVSDGTNVWVTNQGSGTVSKVRAGNRVPALVPPETLVSPCRIMDTRAASQVGPRGTPLAGGETHTIQVTGANGNCVVPADAGGVVLNVTAVGPQSSGFVTVFPGGTTRPTASNLNYTAGQAPVPNQVTVGLGATGQVSFFASGGPVNLVADVVAFTTRSRLTATQFAQLEWDADSGRPGTFPMGGPVSVASDGVDVWAGTLAIPPSPQVFRIDPVTNGALGLTSPTGSSVGFGAGSIWAAGTQVRRIDPGTATVTATVPGAAGELSGVAFGAGSVWVADRSGDRVFRIDPTTNTVVATITVGDQPLELAFGAGRVWVPNSGGDTVSVIDPASNSVVSTIPVGDDPRAAAYDGSSIWVANRVSGGVSRIDPTSVSVVGSTAGGGFDVAFDGTNLLVSGDGGVGRVDPASLADVSVVSVAPNSRGVTFDGTNIWSASQTGDATLKLRAG